ncbi:MAG: hypothetical protein Q8M15_15550 [Bacteroidota bacterium]|nr:hypothetical protein [Bacteroidota bacterium]
MKTIKSFTTTFLFTIIILFSSCKKDETKPVETVSKAPTLTAKDWLLIASKGEALGVTIDLYDKMDACLKDNLTKYNTDKSITAKSGSVKCFPSEPDSYLSGMWTLLENETKLRIIDFDTIDWKLITLNSTTLKVTYSDNSGSTTQTITNTFSAQ